VADEDSESPDLPEQLRIRRQKYDRLHDTLYPVKVARTHSLAEIRAAYPDLAPDEHTGDEVGVTGRVIFARNTGKLCFATLREGGVELQVMVSLDRVGADSLAAWKSDVDLGDLVFATVRSSPLVEVSCPCWPTPGKSRRKRCARCQSRTVRCPRNPRSGCGTSI
jgi:lysyl-tRNA synthetase class 2